MMEYIYLARKLYTVAGWVRSLSKAYIKRRSRTSKFNTKLRFNMQDVVRVVKDPRKGYLPYHFLVDLTPEAVELATKRFFNNNVIGLLQRNKGSANRFVLGYFIKRLFFEAQFNELSDIEKANFIHLQVTYFAVFSELNKALNKNSYVSLEFIKKSSEIVLKRVSDRQTAVSVEFDEKIMFPVDRFFAKFIYRDPNIGRRAWHPRRPYIQKGAPRGIVHDGASRSFKRYAIDEVKIFGKKYVGNRTGKRFAGLGYEPLGFKPKSAGRYPKDYVPFIRESYPGRANPDRLLGSRGRIAVFPALFANKAAVQRITFASQKAVLRYFNGSAIQRNEMAIEFTQLARNSVDRLGSIRHYLRVSGYTELAADFAAAGLELAHRRVEKYQKRILNRLKFRIPRNKYVRRAKALYDNASLLRPPGPLRLKGQSIAKFPRRRRRR